MRTRTQLLLGCAAVLAAGAPQLAGAQGRPPAPPVVYREGLPPVNAPQPEVDPNLGNYSVSSAFARWNQAQGRPSMLLFWNRELIEDATTQYDTVTSRQTAAVGGAAASRGSRGYVAGAAVVTASEKREYQERSTTGAYGFADDVYAKSVESAMLGAFLTAGARIVDREALMRKISATKSRDERLDVQHLETLALGQNVQYLVEVLPDEDPGSPTGVSFTVKVTHLPTATVRAQFVTAAEPPTGPAKFVAAPGGFEKRVALADHTPAKLGGQLAYETMARLR